MREAIRSHDFNLVKILIRKGADPSGRPDLYTDDTPLALAADEGWFEIMHYLLSTGAQVINFNRIATRIPDDLRNGEDYEEILTELKEADYR